MAGSVPAPAEGGSAEVCSVWKSDVLQRAETGAAAARAAGADENLRLGTDTGKIRPAVRKRLKNGRLININDENDVIDWCSGHGGAHQHRAKDKISDFFSSAFAF